MRELSGSTSLSIWHLSSLGISVLHVYCGVLHTVCCVFVCVALRCIVLHCVCVCVRACVLRVCVCVCVRVRIVLHCVALSVRCVRIACASANDLFEV